MTNSRGARSGRLVRSAIAVTAIGLALPAAAAAAGTDTYIVQLKDAPLASYTGGTKGIPATSPKVTGNKVKVDSAPGLDYSSYLAGRQKAVLNRLPGAKPDVVESYRVALAGFSAKLTEDQAKRIEKDAGVARVWKDTLLQPMQAADDPDTRLGGFNGDGASYLRLTDQTAGLWKKLGGPVNRNGAGAAAVRDRDLERRASCSRHHPQALDLTAEAGGLSQLHIADVGDVEALVPVLQSSLVEVGYGGRETLLRPVPQTHMTEDRARQFGWEPGPVWVGVPLKQPMEYG